MSNVAIFPQRDTVHICKSRAEAEYRMFNTLNMERAEIDEIDGAWTLKITTWPDTMSQAVANARKEWNV